MLTSSFLAAVVPLLMAASPAAAFSCSTHTFTTCEDRIVHWYDPDDGMICDPLDCGGGRAPPKTNVPGCPQYKGTLTRATSASYLSCWTKPGLNTARPATSTPVVAVDASSSSAAAVKSSETKAAPQTSSTGDASPSQQSSATTDAPQATAPQTTAAATQSGDDKGSASASSTKTEPPKTTASGAAGKMAAGSFAAVAAAAVAFL